MLLQKNSPSKLVRKRNNSKNLVGYDLRGSRTKKRPLEITAMLRGVLHSFVLLTGSRKYFCSAFQFLRRNDIMKEKRDLSPKGSDFLGTADCIYYCDGPFFNYEIFSRRGEIFHPASVIRTAGGLLPDGIPRRNAAAGFKEKKRAEKKARP